MNEQKTIEMTNGQAAKVSRLIEKECCNCVDSICIMQDHGYGWYCPQMGTKILFCPCLKKAVLPMDENLRRELLGGDKGKDCEMCLREFTPKSNRARFCPGCAKKNRRMKEAERQRIRYHRSTHLEHLQPCPDAAFGTWNSVCR